MTKEISKLNNNIEYMYKYNANTPRIAVCLNFSINKPDIKHGIYSLMSRLLLQGTKNYNSEELATEFEKFAIDFSTNTTPNFLQLKFACLNEDFEKAMELLNEVLVNSTFEEFEKERTKLKFEIPAQLDSPKMVVVDSYCSTIFKDHYYGVSLNMTLESIDTITKDDVVEAFNYIMHNSKKSIAIVGSIDKDKVLPLVESTVGKLPESIEGNLQIEKPILNESREVINHKSDLNQAHIMKGWIVPTYGEKEYYSLLLLNIILGSSGLSSRLFLELRDKKGLAYVVRSSYETLKLAGNFMIYIATEPSNIETCLKGFDEEITKIKTIPVSEKELDDAKNNLIGKFAFMEETNAQQANYCAKFDILGYGFDFAQTIKQKIQEVTIQDISDTANKCFNENYTLSIIKP